MRLLLQTHAVLLVHSTKTDVRHQDLALTPLWATEAILYTIERHAVCLQQVMLLWHCHGPMKRWCAQWNIKYTPDEQANRHFKRAGTGGKCTYHQHLSRLELLPGPMQHQ